LTSITQPSSRSERSSDLGSSATFTARKRRPPRTCRWIVEDPGPSTSSWLARLLQLLDEQHDSVRVRFEQPGDDHFEWWVQRADGSRTYTQVKRQQAPDKEWTIGTLVSRGVLTAFGERLGQEPSAWCEFFPLCLLPTCKT
jgi:hypothetical protein